MARQRAVCLLVTLIFVGLFMIYQLTAGSSDLTAVSHYDPYRTPERDFKTHATTAAKTKKPTQRPPVFVKKPPPQTMAATTPSLPEKVTQHIPIGNPNPIAQESIFTKRKYVKVLANRRNGVLAKKKRL